MLRRQKRIIYVLKCNIFFINKLEECVINLKHAVKTGYNTIAKEYLKTRSENSEDVKLLQELIQLFPTVDALTEGLKVETW